MKLYHFYDGDSGRDYYAAKSDAVKMARKCAKHWNLPVTIFRDHVRDDIGPTQLAVAMLSGRDWCAKSVAIGTVQPCTRGGLEAGALELKYREAAE